jgi:hypothetical protein
MEFKIMPFKVNVDITPDEINKSFLVSDERMEFLIKKMNEVVDSHHEEVKNGANLTLVCISSVSEFVENVNELAYITFKMTSAILKSEYESEMRMLKALVKLQQTLVDAK